MVQGKPCPISLGECREPIKNSGGGVLSSLGLGWIGEPAIAHLLEKPLGSLGVPDVAVHTIAFVIAFATITVLHIVLSELAPNSIAIQRAEGTVLNVARPLILFYRLMYPFIWILMNQSHRSGLIDNTEMALFDNIFEFSGRIAREIMVPRIDMATIDISDTRYPVSQGDKDIIGFVYVKDLYLPMNREEGFSIQHMLRKVIMVSEVAEISAVLKRQPDRKNRDSTVARSGMGIGSKP